MRLYRRFLYTLRRFFLHDFSLYCLLFYYILQDEFYGSVFRYLGIDLCDYLLYNVSFITGLFSYLLYLRCRDIYFISYVSYFFAFLVLDLRFDYFFCDFVSVIVERVEAYYSYGVLLFAYSGVLDECVCSAVYVSVRYGFGLQSSA